MTVLSVIRVTRPPDQSHPNWAKRISPSTVIWVNWVPFFTIFLLFISVSFLSFAIFTVATKQKKRNESQCLICQFCILRCWLSRPLFAKSLNSYSRKSYRKKQRKQKKNIWRSCCHFGIFPPFCFPFLSSLENWNKNCCYSVTECFNGCDVYSTAPKAVILGGPEFHVDVGSHVNLTCIVQYSPEPPEYVFWHHHDQVREEIIDFLFVSPCRLIIQSSTLFSSCWHFLLAGARAKIVGGQVFSFSHPHTVTRFFLSLYSLFPRKKFSISKNFWLKYNEARMLRIPLLGTRRSIISFSVAVANNNVNT